MTRFTAGDAPAAIRRWYDSAINAVDPVHAVAASLRRSGNTVFIADQQVNVAGRLFVVAIGKAGATMAAGAQIALDDLISGGVIITKDGHIGSAELPTFEIFEASHPIPDERGRAATEYLLDRLENLGPDDVVMVLLSGGGSALLEAPVDGVPMADMATTTGLLLRAGAPIQHLNAVRVPLSKVKGGGLRRTAYDSRFVTLVLSDVLGNDTRVIASGPTVTTDFTGEGALELLTHYGVLDSTPVSVREALSQSANTQSAAVFENDIVQFVGDNAIAVNAFASAARHDEVRMEVLFENAEGEASELAVEWVTSIVAADPAVDLFLGGGEATVKVRGNGTGGRNTEFVLAAALELERIGRIDWMIASLATDGQDALTGVAGAIATVETLNTARRAGVDPVAALEQNDSLAVFRAANACVEPGPTGTNVNDIYVALRLAT